MRSKHVYASVDLFKDYLAGDSYANGWTDDVTVVRRLLESASITIESYVGNRCFAPYTATREYDLGKGELRNRSELPRDKHIILATDPVLGVVPLKDWLTAVPATVTAYDSSARDSNTELTEGLSNDYVLEPYPQAPYHTLKLSENTANNLSQGQKTLTILGEWGWQDETELTDNAVNDGSNIDASQTTITYDGSGDLSAGEILLLDSEQIYVRSLTSTVLTVDRGVNGSTAATHNDDAAFSRYKYPSDVVEACLAIARDRWRSREAGTTAVIGTAGAAITRPGAEERAILRTLTHYKQERELAGTYF
jgi:hypothetical protein